MKSYANKELEIHFDCGSRVKEIRNDLGLSVGEFIELISFLSQKDWDDIEKGKQELGISFLEKIHQTTGASLDWLKYGSSKFDWSYFIKSPLIYLSEPPQPPAKFFPIDLKLYSPDSVDDAISQIEALQPEDIYFAIDYDAEDYTECASHLLVILCKEHYWQVFEATNLSFWKWDGDASCIQYIFDFMYKIVKNEELSFATRGIYLTQSEMNILLSGKKHPSIIVSQARRKIHEKKYHQNTRHWVEDIIDINYENIGSHTNYNQWYGQWFIEVQKVFKEYVSLPLITEEKDDDSHVIENQKELDSTLISHIIYVEGKLDEEYFSFAIKLFNLQHLGLAFYQIGRETTKGTVGGGKGALINFLKYLKRHHDRILLPHKTIILFDCDVKNTRDEIIPDNYRNLRCGVVNIEYIDFNKKNRFYDKGIENFLSLPDDFNKRKFFEINENIKKEDLNKGKKKLRDWICQGKSLDKSLKKLSEEEQRKILINFKDFLIKLAELK